MEVEQGIRIVSRCGALRGVRNGTPVVLVHGTPFSSYVWRRVVPALAETMRVYAFDLPGYGSSEKREGQDVSLAAQGRVLSGLLDHLGLDKASRRWARLRRRHHPQGPPPGGARLPRHRPHRRGGPLPLGLVLTASSRTT